MTDQTPPPQNLTATTPPTPIKTGPKLAFDWREWQPHLESSDLSEDQQRQLIETLWSIVIAFVDLGWDIDTEETCGQNLDLTALLNAAVVHSDSVAEHKEGA